MNQREIAISSINGLRHIIAQKLILALNQHWNDAAYGKISLNQETVMSLVKTIKNCAQLILQTCQAQNHLPWNLVHGKKRFSNVHEDCPLVKIKRYEDKENMEGSLTE